MKPATLIVGGLATAGAVFLGWRLWKVRRGDVVTDMPASVSAPPVSRDVVSGRAGRCPKGFVPGRDPITRRLTCVVWGGRRTA